MLRQFVAFLLVTAHFRARLLALPALGQGLDHVLALCRLAPVGALGIERIARQRHIFTLLHHRLAERARKVWKSRMPTTSRPAPALAAKPVSYSSRYFLERRELLLHLGQVALGGADALGAFALGARRGLLNHVETFGTLHAGALPAGAPANNWRSAFTASVWLTRCSMGCMRNFCIAGHSSMAVSMRASLPRW